MTASTFTLAPWDAINGTHLQGYVGPCTRAYLTEIFGEPDTADFDKVNCEWRIIFDDGTVATIYDWKRYSDMPMDLPYTWHVGGHTDAAVDKVAVAAGVPSRKGW